MSEVSRRAVIVGTGLVGRATVTLLAEAGFQVFGFDTNERALQGFPGFRIVSPGNASRWDIVIIAVPTPVEGGAMSTAALVEAARTATTLVEASEVPALVAVRSTLMPRMMSEVVAPLLGRAEGRLAGLCCWPCFARERAAVAEERQPRVVVFGTPDQPAVHKVLGEWLENLACPVLFTSWETAELAKAGANAFNALKISYFNALADWADVVDGDGQQVGDIVATAAEGAWNPRYGTRVGPAFGGACLPKDLEALTAWLREAALPHAALLDAVREINGSPLRVPPVESS
jgi:UDPglucose 6-dehydrogenase